MDPLSQTASIIAVLSVAGSCVQGLKAARKFLKSGEEIDRLIDGTEKLCSLFKTIERLQRQQSSLYESFPELLQIVNDAKDQILELKKLVVYDLKPLGRPSRKAWLFKKDEVDRIRGCLKDVCLRLSTLLSSITNSQLYVVIEKANNAELKQEETSQLLKSLVIGQEALKYQFRSFVEQAPYRNDTRCLTPADNHELKEKHILDSNSAKQTSKQRIITNLATDSSNSFIPSVSREGCPLCCDCDCHSKIHWTSPRMLDWLLGQLAINAPETAIFKRKCDKPGCRQSMISQVRMTYKLPLWAIKKGFLLLMSRELLQGPEMLLRMQRIRPEDAEVFYYADLGDVWQLRYLFETGQASPWDVTPTGETTLLKALRSRGYEMTKYLMCQGADKDFEDQEKMSAVSYAWYDFLMDRPHSEADTAVATEDMIYEFFGETDFVHTEKFSRLHRIVTGFENTSLEDAICSGKLDDLNALDLHNRTPLFWAAVRGDVGKVRTLLEYGASPHAGQRIYSEILRCIDVDSPFDDDTRNLNLLEIATILDSVGACNEFQGSRAFTILHVAAQHADGALIIESFMNGDSNFSMRNDAGLTPLDYACNGFRPSNVESLIYAGADVNCSDALHVPSIFYAVMRRDVESIEILLEAGAKLDYVDFVDGELSGTILHKIARWADVHTIEVFIEAPDLSSMPDPEQQNMKGETALQLFLRRKEHSIDFEEIHTSFITLLERVRACRIPSERDRIYADYFRLPGSWPEDSDPSPIKNKEEEEIDTDERQNSQDYDEVGHVANSVQRECLDDSCSTDDTEKALRSQ